MPIFEPKIQHVKLTFSPLSAESMATVAQVLRDHMVERMSGAKDAQDNWSRPLTEKYKIEKSNGRYVANSPLRKYRGIPIRNWTLRGRTLDAVRVKFASQDAAKIGPTTNETAMIITARNKLDHMWGASPSDTDVMVKAMLAVMREQEIVRVDHIHGAVAA